MSTVPSVTTATTVRTARIVNNAPSVSVVLVFTVNPVGWIIWPLPNSPVVGV